MSRISSSTRLAILSCAVCALWAAPSHAGGPEVVIPWQARLIDVHGVALNGPTDVTLSLYADPDAGTPGSGSLWSYQY